MAELKHISEMNKEELEVYLAFTMKMPELGAVVKRLFQLCKQEESKSNKIRIKYADNEYGKIAAKEFAVPQHAYVGDAGLDLPVVLNEDERHHGCKLIYPNEREKLHTGMTMEFPVGYWGLIMHRSSTEARHRLRVVAGIIDDYRGEILVQVHNGNTYPIEIKHGQHLGQLIILPTSSFTCEIATQLRPSARASKGFGSSGK